MSLVPVCWISVAIPCHYVQVQEHRQVMAVPSLESNGGDGIQGRETVQSHDVGCYELN